MHPDELLKARQEAQAKWAQENSLNQAQVGSRTMGLTNESPGTPHPREFLLADLNDQEQRLLDKLAAMRELRQEILCLSRPESELLQKFARLMKRLQ